LPAPLPLKCSLRRLRGRHRCRKKVGIFIGLFLFRSLHLHRLVDVHATPAAADPCRRRRS
jgi:hypothetical protein